MIIYVVYDNNLNSKQCHKCTDINATNGCASFSLKVLDTDCLSPHAFVPKRMGRTELILSPQVASSAFTSQGLSSARPLHINGTEKLSPLPGRMSR